MKRVYFIKPIGFDGPIKIGTSCDPTGRGKSLELWCPFPLEVLASLPGGLELERRFHARFFEQHRNHEWFEATDDLVATIDAINAGTFSIDTLPQGRSLQRSAKRGGRRKWTQEEKDEVRLRNAVKRAERSSGWLLDFPRTLDRCAAFVANPCRATGGIRPSTFQRRMKARQEAFHRRMEQTA